MSKTLISFTIVVTGVIAKDGGTMPEELPTPDKSLKELEKESNKELIIKH